MGGGGVAWEENIKWGDSFIENVKADNDASYQFLFSLRLLKRSLSFK